MKRNKGQAAASVSVGDLLEIWGMNADDTIETPWMDLQPSDLAKLIIDRFGEAATPDDMGEPAEWMDATSDTPCGQIRFTPTAVALFLAREYDNANRRILAERIAKITDKAERDRLTALLDNDGVDATAEDMECEDSLVRLSQLMQERVVPIPGQPYRMDVTAHKESRACGIVGPVRSPAKGNNTASPVVLPYASKRTNDFAPKRQNVKAKARL